MSRAGVEELQYNDSVPSVSLLNADPFAQPRAWRHKQRDVATAGDESFARPRRTPRRSLIVVLGDNHVLSGDAVARRLPSDDGNADDVDVIVACAGQPKNLAALQRRVRDLQVLLAPAGTSTEDLRELAIQRAAGDIVTLVSGFAAEREDGLLKEITAG